MLKQAQPYFIGLILIAFGVMVGVSIFTPDSGASDRITALETRLGTFEKNTGEWQKHMVRNSDALKTWTEARDKELIFQSSVIHRLDVFDRRLLQQNCVLCQMTGPAGGCKQICFDGKQGAGRAN